MTIPPDHQYHSGPPPQAGTIPPAKKKMSGWKIAGIIVVGLWAMGTCSNFMGDVKTEMATQEAAEVLAAMTPEQRAEAARQEEARKQAAALKAANEDAAREQAAAQREAEAAQREADKRKPVASYTSIQITNAYHNNEVAADDALKGRFVQVTGKIKDIRKDFMDDIIIDLRGERGRWSFSDVHCELDDDDPTATSAAVRLRKGQTASFVCKVKGMILKSVMLGECRLVQ